MISNSHRFVSPNQTSDKDHDTSGQKLRSAQPFPGDRYGPVGQNRGPEGTAEFSHQAG